jgi:F420-dependent oxidoreductase-like protein
MRIGMFGGDTAGRSIDSVVDDARRAATDGFASYTLPQIFGLDAMGVLAVVGREVPDIRLATGVVPTYGRHPLTMAQQALTVQSTSGGRFVLGIGLSHQMVIENMFGLSFDRPLRHMREYLAALMPLLHERAVASTGDVITTNASIGVAAADVPAPPVLVAALGPKMLELAGTVADGTMTWMTGPATLAAHTVPTIAQAATRAGRPAPSVYTSLPICVTDDIDAARERGNREFSVYGFLPSYRAMLDREGAEHPGDVALLGDEDAVGAQLDGLAEAGVTEFVASIFGERDDRERTRELLRGRLAASR